MLVRQLLDFEQFGGRGLIKGDLRVGLGCFEDLELEKAVVEGSEGFKVLL